jgi:hypothetical protein
MRWLTNNKGDIIAVIVWLVIFTIFLCLTFQKWGSPVIDCGRDPYIAEQILGGKILYKDLYYPYGPLAPYVLAFLFMLFGIHLNIAYACGILVALFILFLLYRAARLILSPFLSSVIVIATIFECCFNHLLFNYIFPYAYSALFGTFFSILFILFIGLHIKKPHQIYLYANSLIAGLALITKIEFGFALTTLFAVYLLYLHLHKHFSGVKTYFYLLLPLLGISLLPYILLYSQIGSPGIQTYIEYSRITLNSEPSQYIIQNQFGLPFFLQTLGNLPFMLLKIAGFILITNLLVYGFRKIGAGIGVTVFAILSGISLVLVLLLGLSELYTQIFTIKYYLFSYLPIFCLLAIVIYLFLVYQQKIILKKEHAFIFFIILFGLLINLRNFFSFNSVTYGVFYLPPLLIVIFYYLKIIAENVKSTGRLQLDIRPYWITSWTIIIIFFILAKPHFLYLTNDTAIQTERGTIYAPANIAKPLNKLIDIIEKNTDVNDDIVLIPEEVLIYFLVNRSSATIFNDYLPIRLTTTEQEEYLINEIKKKDVKLIAISNRSTFDDYKYPFWGLHYNQKVYHWIQNNYQLCQITGNYQIHQHFYEGYGIKIYMKSCPEEY